MNLVKDTSKCCGCNLCSVVCTHNAINMEPDKYGYLYPRIEQEKCVNCGLCEMKCPLQNIATVNSSVAAYAASYNNVESIRGCCLDELPQVLDLISGDMSFVGTRPEAVKYVEKYKPEYYATLLYFFLLGLQVYIEEVLPGKMKYNLRSIKEFSFVGEIATMFRTVFAVLGKDYSDEEQKNKV